MHHTAFVKSVLPDGNLEIFDNRHLKIGLVDKIKGKDPTWQQLKSLYGKSIVYTETAGLTDQTSLIEILSVEC